MPINRNPPSDSSRPHSRQSSVEPEIPESLRREDALARQQLARDNPTIDQINDENLALAIKNSLSESHSSGQRTATQPQRQLQEPQQTRNTVSRPRQTSGREGARLGNYSAQEQSRYLSENAGSNGLEQGARLGHYTAQEQSAELRRTTRGGGYPESQGARLGNYSAQEQAAVLREGTANNIQTDLEDF